MGEAVRDDNYIPAWLGVSSADGTTPLPVLIDPVSGRVLVEAPGGGGGDVVGPGSATDNAIARFDGVTGLLIQESIIILGDTGTMASTGLLGFSDQYQAGSTYSTDLVLSDAIAEWDTFEVNFGEVSLLDAFNQLAAGTIGGNTLDQAYDEGGAGAGRAIIADNGAVSITVPDTSNNSALSLVNSDVTNNPDTFTITDSTTGDSIFIDKNGSGIALSIDLDSNSASNSVGAVMSVHGAGTGTLIGAQSDVRMTGAGTVTNVVAQTAVIMNTGAGTITNAIGWRIQVFESAGIITNAIAFALLLHSGTPTNTYVFRLDPGDDWKSGESLPVDDGGTDKFIPLSLANTGITRDSEDLIFQTTTSGDIHLLAATELVISDENQVGSTYASELILSDTSAEWDTFEVNFGEVSLLNAINQAIVNQTITLTGDITGAGTTTIATTIAAGAVDIAMLANGTDGELITWDAAGAPDTVAVGTANHVLTSNGPGAAPTFQAIPDVTLQIAFDNGQTITIADTDNQTLAITNNDVTNSPDTMTVTTATDGNGIVVTHSGVLAASKHALHLYSNVAQVNSELLFLEQDNASSTADVMKVQNDGTGMAIQITQIGVLAAGKNALEIVSSINQTESTTALVGFGITNASSVASVQVIHNDGLGHGLAIEQDGVNATGFYALSVVSSAVQVNEPVAFFKQGNASSTYGCLELENVGTGDSLFINQIGVLAVTKNALEVVSATDQNVATRALVGFGLTNSSSIATVANLVNAGTGYTLFLDANNSGTVMGVDSTANDANDCIGLDVNLQNAGAGGEFAFKFNGSEHDTETQGGTAGGRIAIKDGDVTKYLYMYTD